MPDLLIPLLLWGMAAGLDLVSFPQGLLNRPLVAAGVAGLLMGDPALGLAIGMVLELFALDVLPIGASRYPDYGPAAVVAVASASGLETLGPAVIVGLLVAQLGGVGMELVRRRNGQLATRHALALDAGDAGTIAHLQRAGLTADLLRAAVVTGLGLVAGPVVAEAMRPAAGSLGLVVVAGGLAAALHGVVRRAGAGIGLRWAALGLLLGGAVAWLR